MDLANFMKALRLLGQKSCLVKGLNLTSRVAYTHLTSLFARLVRTWLTVTTHVRTVAPPWTESETLQTTVGHTDNNNNNNNICPHCHDTWYMIHGYHGFMAFFVMDWHPCLGIAAIITSTAKDLCTGGIQNNWWMITIPLLVSNCVIRCIILNSSIEKSRRMEKLQQADKHKPKSNCCCWRGGDDWKLCEIYFWINALCCWW